MIDAFNDIAIRNSVDLPIAGQEVVGLSASPQRQVRCPVLQLGSVVGMVL